MPVITTLEDLRALDPGTAVTVERHGNHAPRTYVLSDTGLTYEQATIPLDQFTGLLGRSLVSVGERYEAGALFNDNGYNYLVITDPDEQGNFMLAALGSDGNLIAVNHYHRDSGLSLGTRTPVRPEWYRTVLTLCQRIDRAEKAYANEQRLRREQANEGSQQEREEAEVARRERDSMRTQYNNLHAALGDWAQENPDDLTSDLTEILEDHDISWRAMSDVTVTVDISGTSEIDFEGPAGGLAGVEELIQPNRRADWSDRQETVATITWTHTATPEFEETDGECACGHVDRDWVREYLNDNNFNFEEFEFEVSCENC